MRHFGLYRGPLLLPTLTRNTLEGKILIADRGEIAIRIMSACRDLNIDYVVVYTAADRESEHVRQNITNGPEQNAWRISSYTEVNDIFAVADHTGCSAIHPGYGFLSEDFRFARRATTRDRSLTFIGPNWKVIRDLGDKINAKRLAGKLGIPTLAGSKAPIYNEIEAEKIATQLFKVPQGKAIDTPSILIKAAVGGGGLGIEEVSDLSQFRRIYRRLENYAKRQFGDGRLLIERCLKECHLIELQVVCSRHNERVHFHTRNATIQSTGRQKRVESAPGFDRSCCSYSFNEKEALDQIIHYSLQLAEYVKYDSIGTWEWLVSGSGEIYLIEVNPRVQVGTALSGCICLIDNEHPDLIREQIRLALGEKLGYKQRSIRTTGAAIELRIVAENSHRDFTPWVGTITEFNYPDHPWSITYSQVPTDIPYTIPSEFDPNLALAIVWGETMADAKEKAVQFLTETTIAGKNIKGNPLITNLEYLKNSVVHALSF